MSDDRLTLIRKALAEAARVIPDMAVFHYWPMSPPVPCAYVFPGPVDYHQAMQNGLEMWQLQVRAAVGTAGGDEGPQIDLDRLLAPGGDQNMKDALEQAAITGIADDVTVESCAGYQQFEIDGLAGVYLGSTWTVGVLLGGN